MKDTYKLDLNDMMNYQEQLFLSKQVPSIINAVKRIEKVVLFLLFFSSIIIY